MKVVGRQPLLADAQQVAVDLEPGDDIEQSGLMNTRHATRLPRPRP